MTYLIGVDCGGTHIVGQTWTTSPEHLVQSVTGGPGNVVLDYTGAVTNLTGVLDQLVASIPTDQVGLILIGIAGIETAGHADDIQQLVDQRYQIKTRVISDAKLALLNGLAGDDGLLVIAGTGSVVYGRQTGHFLRVGGWGYVLGDEGSAYDISKRALKQILTRTDAGQASQLTKPLLAQLNVSSVPVAVQRFYAQNRQTNAQLAQLIAGLADQGNSEAIAVLVASAQALAKQVITLYQRFDTPRPQNIVLSGSVLQHNQLVRAALTTAIHQAEPTIKFNDITTNNAHAALYWHRWAQEDNN